MTEQRCGNCRWWRPIDVYRGAKQYGECCAPMPDCVNPDDNEWMLGIEGQSCVCWQEKEKP